MGRYWRRALRVLSRSKIGGCDQMNGATLATGDLLQIALSIIAVGGIGGIWFRLGALMSTVESHNQRLNRLENN
jgi:hypothetical protein